MQFFVIAMIVRYRQVLINGSVCGCLWKNFNLLVVSHQPIRAQGAPGNRYIINFVLIAVRLCVRKLRQAIFTP